MSLFVGRLPPHIRERDLENIFYRYGRITRCQVKRGVSYCKSYGFVEFDSRRDAREAMKDTDGMYIDGVRMIVERAKGAVRRGSDPNTCFRCDQEGHWARDCQSSRRRYQSPRYSSRSRSSHSSSLRSRSYSRSRTPPRSRHRRRSYSYSPSRRSRRRGEGRRDYYSSRSRSRHDRYSRSRSPSSRRGTRSRS